MTVTLHFTQKDWIGKAIDFRGLQFSGGEPHVDILYPGTCPGGNMLIDARVNSPADFLCMLALTDAVRRCRPKSLSLFLPYFPGGRQDHPEIGTPFTAKIYADIINAQKFDNVLIVDPHSAVTPALLERCTVFTARDCVGGHAAGLYDAVIAPDAGAEKRAHAVATLIDAPLFVGTKVREPSTGRITDYRLPSLAGDKILVVDDICDGGATFLLLADAINAGQDNAPKPHLYVTHGIFSKGTSGLLNRYDRIITTDSFPQPEHVPDTKIKVIELLTTFGKQIAARINA